MKCPFCGHTKDKVVDSRESGSEDALRRRRECLSCGRRFTSYERIEEIPYLVVKKDGQREAFDHGKLMAGLHRACEKRPVSAKALTALVDEVEQIVQDSPDREVETAAVALDLDPAVGDGVPHRPQLDGPLVDLDRDQPA